MDLSGKYIVKIPKEGRDYRKLRVNNNGMELSYCYESGLIVIFVCGLHPVYFYIYAVFISCHDDLQFTMLCMTGFMLYPKA